MRLPVSEGVAKTDRHTTFYLDAGAADGPPIVFVHGWPELSRSWRHQLPCFADLGFRAVAPDMRGYGRSDVYRRHEDYALEHAVRDLSTVCGQRAVVTKARNAISSFRLRQGMPIGAVVTLRSAKMYEFLDRLVTIVVPRKPPGTPRSFTLVRGNGQVRLSWKAPSSNGGAPILDYVVQISLNGTTWTTVPDPVSTGLTLTVTGLTNGVKYWFRVAAANAAGKGTNTSRRSVTPRAA